MVGVSEPLWIFLDGSLLTFTKHDLRKNNENASKLTAVYIIYIYLYRFFLILQTNPDQKWRSIYPINNTKIIQIWYNIKIPNQKVICISFRATICCEIFFKPFYFRQCDPFIYRYTSSFLCFSKISLLYPVVLFVFPSLVEICPVGSFVSSVCSVEGGKKNQHWFFVLSFSLSVRLLRQRPNQRETYI